MSLHKFHSGHILGLATLFAPPASILVPSLIVPITLAVLAALVTRRTSGHGGGAQLFMPLAIIIGVILAWLVLSLFWTVNHESAVLKCVLLVAFILLAVTGFTLRPVLAEHEKHVLRRYLLAGVTAGFLLFLIDAATSGAISKSFAVDTVPRTSALSTVTPSSAVFFLFIWPIIAIFWRSMPIVSVGIIVIGFIAAFSLPGTIALIGITIGTAFFGASLVTSRGANVFVAAIVAVGVLIAPFMPRIAPVLDPLTIRESISKPDAPLLHRLDIWNFTIGKIGERPLAGWGFNASPSIPGGNTRYDLLDRSGVMIDQVIRLPSHPHSGPLQVWLELGLPGAVGFAALFALAALCSAWLNDRADAAAALAAIATAVPIWFLGFDIWEFWWIAVMVLTTLLTTALAVPYRE